MKHLLHSAASILVLSIVLGAAPLRAQSAVSPAGGDNENLRLSLARVAVLSETGKFGEAAALIKELKTRYPNNPQVLVVESDLSLRTGNRGAAFASLSKALMADPGNEDVLARQRSALLAQGPFVSGDYNVRRTRQAREQISQAGGQVILMPMVTGRVVVENNALRTRGTFTNERGAQERFSGNRQRVTATLGKIYDSGNEAGASLYGGNGIVGGGVQLSMWDPYGVTAARLNVRRPEWDYVETVIQNGVKDNIRLERRQRLADRLEAALGAGFSRYGIDGDSDVARAGGWDLNVAYTYPYALSKKASDEIVFGVYYTVDAEYFTSIDQRTDVFGSRFKPLPAASYEVHSVNVSGSWDLAPQWHAEGFGGYGLDRLGGDGPLFGASVVFSPTERLAAEVRASRGIMGERSTGNSGGKVDQLGLNVKWLW